MPRTLHIEKCRWLLARSHDAWRWRFLLQLLKPGLLPIQALRLANASPYRGGVLQAVECIMDWAQEIYLDCESLKNYMETSTVGTNPKTPLARCRNEPASSAPPSADTAADISSHPREAPFPLVPPQQGAARTDAAPADFLPSFSQMLLPTACASAPLAKPQKARQERRRDTKGAGAKSSKEQDEAASPAARASASPASIHERQASMAIEAAKNIIIRKVRPSNNDTQRFDEELMRGLQEVAAGKRRRRADDGDALCEEDQSDNEVEQENKQHRKKKNNKGNRAKDVSAASSEDLIFHPSHKNASERDDKKCKTKSKCAESGGCNGNKGAPTVAGNADDRNREVVQMTPSGDVSFSSVRRPGDFVAAAGTSHFGSSQLASTLLAASEAAMLNPRPAPAAAVESARANLDDSDCQIVEAAVAAVPATTQPSDESDDEDDDRALFQTDCFGDISF